MARDHSAQPSLCPFGRRAVEQILDAGLCRTALHLPSAASTNQVALAEMSAEGPRPTGSRSTGPRLGEDDYPRLIVADQQTAGRGRQGRFWYSDSGTLTFSFVSSREALRLTDAMVPMVALAVGMAVADAVEAFVPPYQVRLKWPNDLYAGGGKVGGVLVESATADSRRLVIGIGINVATDLEQADEEVRHKARSLVGLTGRSLQRYDLLPLIIACLGDRLAQLQSQTSRLLDQYRGRCLLTGRDVRFVRDQQARTGCVLGIDDSGALQIQTPHGLETVRSGEVTLEWKPNE